MTQLDCFMIREVGVLITTGYFAAGRNKVFRIGWKSIFVVCPDHGLSRLIDLFDFGSEDGPPLTPSSSVVDGFF
jgi:hypothetical protein